MNKENKKFNRVFIITLFFIIILSYSFKVYADSDIDIDANAALIVEAETGKVIYDKKSDVRNYPASVTKILTAIITIENCNLDEYAIVSENAISNIPSGYVVTPLYTGEKIKIKDLLYALMLKSANDAAYVLAEYIGGSVDGFSDIMNNKAKELGCKDTHFVNPNGIHNSNHYTTAYDMYLITNYAMKNQTFAKIVSTYEYAISPTNKYEYNDRIMENTNDFINPNSSFYKKIVRGVKTGTTTQAGNCLITDSYENGLHFITVILGAETEKSKFSETRKMINYAYDNYTISKLHKKGDIIKSVEVKNATKETKNLNIIVAEDIKIFNNIAINIKEIQPEIIFYKDICAPIKENQELGTVKFNVDGLEYTTKLLAQKDVEIKTYYKEIFAGTGMIFIFFIIFIKGKKQKYS